MSCERVIPVDFKLGTTEPLILRLCTPMPSADDPLGVQNREPIDLTGSILEFEILDKTAVIETLSVESGHITLDELNGLVYIAITDDAEKLLYDKHSARLMMTDTAGTRSVLMHFMIKVGY